MKKNILILLFFLTIPLAKADDKFLKGAFFTYENDSVYGPDKYYTNGIQFSFITKDYYNNLNLFENKLYHNFSFGFGQKIYTPKNIKLNQPQFEDRPYAGYLYFFLNTNIIYNNFIDSFGINLGLTGEISFGEQAQKIVHDMIGSPEPMGWKYQIPNEVLLMLSWSRIWQFNNPLPYTYDWLLMPKINTNLGTPFTTFSPAIEFRYGWNLQKNDLVPHKMLPTIANISSNKEMSYYVFFELMANLNLHNTFLDKNGENIINDIDREIINYDIIFGLNFNINNFYVKYSNIYTTKEFKQQHKNQLIFLLTLGYNF